MASLKRQTTYTYQVFDDQSPELWGSYAGNWTHYPDMDGFYNKTLTATPNPGATFSFAFTGISAVPAQSSLRGTDAVNNVGSQATLYGGVLNNTYDNITYFLGWPTAEYMVDGIPGELLDKCALGTRLLLMVPQKGTRCPT